MPDLTFDVHCQRTDRDEWHVLKLDGVQFDWRNDGRILLNWRVRFPLPDAGETKLTLTRVRLTAPVSEKAHAERDYLGIQSFQQDTTALYLRFCT